MEQVIFILIAVVVGILQWMSKRVDTFDSGDSGDSGDSEPFKTFTPAPPSVQPPPTPPVRKSASEAKRAESEEERMRKFLEAMGLPTEAIAPQRPRSPQQTPPLPRVGPSRREGRDRRVTAQPSGRLGEPSLPPPPAAPAVAPPVQAEKVPAPVFEVNRAAEIERNEPALPPLARLLRQPQDLRTAFVLKEILGTPRGL